MADVRPLLKSFDEAFDQEAAKKAGAIHPVKGEWNLIKSIYNIDKMLMSQTCLKIKAVKTQILRSTLCRLKFQLMLPSSLEASDSATPTPG